MATNLTLWRPHRELLSLHNDLDAWFDTFFGNERAWAARGRRLPLAPAIESFVRDDKLVVRADLPGIDPAAVEIAVEGNRLTIKGERKWTTPESADTERGHSEVAYGSFERTLTLPRGVDPESVEASYKDGVLEVTMKAPSAMVARKVPITVH